jgi:hypothetical protein
VATEDQAYIVVSCEVNISNISRFRLYLFSGPSCSFGTQ